MTDDATIALAAETVDRTHGKLDMLINNAGTVALTVSPLREQMRQAFDTNATGPAILTDAFGPLLRKSTSGRARIVNVSSGAGSINRRLDPTSPMYRMKGGLQYRASKAALSMVTACAVVEYGDSGIKVFAYCPGFTVSNLGPHNTAENGARAVAESVGPLVDVLEGKRDGEAGLFLHNEGVYPW